MNNSRTKHSLINSIWGISEQLIHMIVPFFFRAIIIHHIGAEYIGLNGLFKSILSALNMTELGFGSTIIFMMYKPIAEGNKSELRVLLKLIRYAYLIITVVVLVLGVAIFPFLHLLVKNDTGADVNIYLLYSMYLFQTVMSYAMFSYRTTLLSAHQRRDILSKISVACFVVQYALQAVILVTTKNYYLYMLVFALMVIPHNILYYVATKKFYPDIYCEGEVTRAHLQVLKQKIVPLLGHRIGGTVIISIDSIILSSFLGISVLTKYDNYYFVFSAIVALLSMLRQSVIASIGNKLHSDSIENTYRIFLKLTFMWIGLVGWCGSCMLSLFQPFITLWVGEEYLFGFAGVICIVIYFITWQMRQIGLTMKDAAGLWEQDKWKPYVGMTLNLILSIILVKVTGNMVGVLLPTILVMTAIYLPWETKVLFEHLFKRSPRQYWLLVARCVITVVVSVIGTYLVSALIPSAQIGGFALRTICCAVLFPTIFLVLNMSTEYPRELLRIAKKIIDAIGGKVRSLGH